MTLYEALQDIGKGRFVDNGCSYDLIALAKGTYTFTIRTFKAPYSEKITITVNGKQGENARTLESTFNNTTREMERKAFGTANGALRQVIKAEYKKG